MKKSTTLFFIFSFTVISWCQVPGYQGKKNVFNANIYTHPLQMIYNIGSDENQYHPLILNKELTYQRVLGRRFSLGFGVSYFGYKYSDEKRLIDGGNFRYKTHVMSYSLMFNISKREFLNPIGKSTIFSLTFTKATFGNKNKPLTTSSYNGQETISIEPFTSNDLTVKWGKEYKTVISNSNLFFSTGFNVGLPIGSIFVTNYRLFGGIEKKIEQDIYLNTVLDDFEKILTRTFLFEFKFGLGIIL